MPYILPETIATLSLAIASDQLVDPIGEYDGNPELYEARITGSEGIEDSEIACLVYETERLCCCGISTIDRQYTPDGEEIAVVRYYA